MELLLIRHAEPERIELDDGVADPGLTTAGQEQARQLARHLAVMDIDAVYTSPMRRALETAEAMAAAHSLEPVITDGLAEFDHGSSFYVPIDQLREEGGDRWDALLEGRWGPDGSLDPATFQGRVVATVETIARAHSGGRAALVCHGGVINVYFGHVLGLEFPLFFEPAYTSISRALFHQTGHHQLASLNETPHL
jgi:probable phosphoglycerate mutase